MPIAAALDRDRVRRELLASRISRETTVSAMDLFTSYP
jgi:hypothetical protein